MFVNSRKMKRVAKVKDFGMAYITKFPHDTVGGQKFEVIAGAIATLSDLGGALNSADAGFREAGKRRIRARAVLRETLTAIERTAKAVALDQPGFDVKLSPGNTFTEPQLLACARGVLEHVPAALPALSTLGLPADTAVVLATQIRDLDRTIAEQAEQRAATESVNGRIRTELDKADRAIATLDAIVRNTLGSDTEAMAGWDRAWRLPRVHRKAEVAVEAPAVPQAAA